MKSDKLHGTLSRRGFMKGAAVGAIAAGAAALGACSPSDGGTGAGAEATSDALKQYQEIYPDGANLMPVRKVTCPGPRGPVAFESGDIAEGDITRDEDFDVVVVGAGIGGLMAALKAADMGADVLLLEKMTKGRGCFECFGAVDAKVQKEAKLEIDRAVLLDEIYRSAYYRIRPDAPRTYVDRSGEATDFWQDMLDKGANGFVITPTDEGPSTNGWPALTQFIPSELGFYDSPALPEDANVRSGLSGIYVCLEMQDVAKHAYDNIDMRFSTPAVQLVSDDDSRVTGVVAKDADGYFRANAAQGVIIATGGYDCNPELMEAWVRPEDYAYSSWWNPGWGTTGDGIMMGIKAGAQIDPIPHAVMNFRWGTPDSFADFRTWNAVYLGILVNGRGQRFVREDAPFQVVSNAQNAQPGYGKNCWYIFDEAMSEGIEAGYDEFKEKGWLFEGETAEELAEAIGVDPEGLAETIERYAGFFEGGKDEDFARDLEATMPFTGGKLYAFTTNSNILATGGGLLIDGNCSVLDTNDNPIPGLFACGNASGGFFAGNYPRHIPGTSIGRAITFGYVAAENAVNGTIGVGPKLDGNAPALTPYEEGAAVTDEDLEAMKSLGPWNPYDPIHGSSDLYTPEQLGGNVSACDNCHTYREGGETVADAMKWLSE